MVHLKARTKNAHVRGRKCLNFQFDDRNFCFFNKHLNFEIDTVQRMLQFFRSEVCFRNGMAKEVSKFQLWSPCRSFVKKSTEVPAERFLTCTWSRLKKSLTICPRKIRFSCRVLLQNDHFDKTHHWNESFFVKPGQNHRCFRRYTYLSLVW